MFKWLRRIFNGSNQTNYYNSVVEVKEQPEKPIPKGTLLVIMGGGIPKWLKFSCPCGCRSEHNLPLMPNRIPQWEIIKHEDGKISIFPSVNVKLPGCGAHFWIRRNRVVWAEPTPKQSNKKTKRL